jgi:4-amino-4-deoxy-L-arabinose transferase-like glycosyltransferase
LSRGHVVMLIALVVGALVLRIGLAVWLQVRHPGEARTLDTGSYIGPARALARTGSFASSVTNPLQMYVRTPGYPLFLAAIFRTTGESLIAVAVVQATVVTSGILVAHQIALRLYGSTVALVTAAMMAIDPLQLKSSVMLMTEGLNGLLLLVFAWATFRAFDRDRPHALAAFGMGCALMAATFVRPATVYLPLVIGLLLVIKAFRTPEWRGAWLVATALMLVPCVVGTVGWVARNDRVVHGRSFAGIDGLSMYLYKGGGAIAEDTDTDFVRVKNRLRNEFGLRRPNETQGSYYADMYDRGVELVRQHPRGFVISTAKGFVRETTEMQWEDEVPTPLATLLRAVGVALIGLAVWGAVLALRRPPRTAHVIVLVLIAYVFLLSAGPESGVRFRAPLSPLLILYAAPAVIDLVHRAWPPSPAGRHRKTPTPQPGTRSLRPSVRGR